MKKKQKVEDYQRMNDDHTDMNSCTEMPEGVAADADKKSKG